MYDISSCINNGFLRGVITLPRPNINNGLGLQRLKVAHVCDYIILAQM